MNVELPVTLALRLVPWPRRWLVVQARVRTVGGPEIVYAEAFVRRTRAERAARAANERVKLVGSRHYAQVIRLPHDRR